MNTNNASTRWGLVAVAVIAGMVGAAHVGKLPPALPGIRTELELSLIVGGWLASVFSLTGALFAIVAGLAADRIGPWRFIMIGLAALLLGSLAGAASNSEVILLATRFLEGFGFIAIAVSAPVIVTAVSSDRDKRMALGIWGTYMPAGLALMMLTTPSILNLTDWRGLWIIVAALTSVWFVVVWVASRTAGSPTHATPRRGSTFTNFKLAGSKPGPWLLAASFGLYTIPWIALMVWLPSFLIEEKGLGIFAAAALTAGVVAINVPGNLVAGWMLKAGWSRWSLLVFGALAMGASSFGIFAESLPDWARYVMCLTFSGLGGLIPTAVLAGAPVFAPGPGQIGTVNGILVQGSHIGQVIGPFLVAAVVEATGSWQGAVWVMVGTATIAVVVAAFVGVTEHRLKTE